MNSPFSAVLLAGGHSRRMGRDKALIEVDGMPLWRRQLQLLEAVGASEIFLAGPPRPEWKTAGCTVIPDAQENSGPLGGLVAALRRSSRTHLLTLAVDVPHITSDYLRLLLKLCGHGKGIVPRSDRYEPLVAVYPAQSLPIAEQLLCDVRYSLQEFAARCVAEDFVAEHRIAAADVSRFLNLNTPAELAALAS